MTVLLIVLAVAAFVVVPLVFIWAVCRAAALGDQVVVVPLDEARDRWAA